MSEKDKLDLVHLFAATGLFGTLDAVILEEIAPHLEEMTLEQGDILQEQGSPGTALFVVAKGQLQSVLTQEDGSEQPVRHIGPGEPVGEIEVLTNEPWRTSVYALEATELVRLPRQVLDQLLQRDPQIRTKLSRTIMRRLRQLQLYDMLPDLFGPLDDTMFADITSEMEWVELLRGQCLLQQGDLADSLYVLIDGRLLPIVTEEDGDERIIGEILPGESVGELGILSGDPAMVSIYAARDSELVRFPKAAFDRFSETYPQILRKVMNLVIKRLQNLTSGGPPARAQTELALDVVLVPAGPDAPMADFTRRLAAALESLGSVLVLDEEQFDQLLGWPGAAQLHEDDVDDMRLVAWLNCQESCYRFVLYLADPTPSNWTRRCLRQADQVLIVANAEQDPTPGPVESRLLQRTQDKIGMLQRLILIHPDGSRPPTGTQTWLAPRQVEHHHHLRWDNEADFERLARFVAGRAVGLVLSGGGARGFAHIGAIRAMQEAGIPIDLIGGNSMGSCIAAQHAIGYDTEKMIEINHTWSAQEFVRDVTLPFLAVSSGRRRVKMLRGFFGDVHIEDLWLPYFSVSTNLTYARVEVHRSGPLYRAVLVSTALAGIAPPIVQDSALLADGAYLNDLPMDVMYELCNGGTVIAVDVSPPVDLEGDFEIGEQVSGWKVLWRQINPFAQKSDMPNISTLIQRAGEISNLHGRKERIRQAYANLYMRVPVDDIGTLAFGSIHQAVQIGYDYAQEVLAEWQKTLI